MLLFSCPVVSDSYSVTLILMQWPHGLQRIRPPCPSLCPGVCPSSCPLHQWCHPAISSSDALFSCPQSFPVLGSFPVSQLFASGDQNIGASASASVLPMIIQGLENTDKQKKQNKSHPQPYYSRELLSAFWSWRRSERCSHRGWCVVNSGDCGAQALLLSNEALIKLFGYFTSQVLYL